MVVLVPVKEMVKVAKRKVAKVGKMAKAVKDKAGQGGQGRPVVKAVKVKVKTGRSRKTVVKAAKAGLGGKAPTKVVQSLVQAELMQASKAGEWTVNLANFSVRRPVTIFMMMVALVIVGAIAIPLLPVDLYPNLEILSATVSVSWSGASPGQIEQQITKPIENAMATVTGVTSISSNSRTGSGNVTLQFNYGTNIDQATLTMRDKLDRVRRQLPSDADAPVVSRVDPNSTPIMTLALSGKADLVTLRDLADDIVSPDVTERMALHPLAYPADG